MMLRPRWPSAGPIGGDGFAAPAGTCNFRKPVTFFAMTRYSLRHRRGTGFVVGPLRRLAAAAGLPRGSRPEIPDRGFACPRDVRTRKRAPSHTPSDADG